MQGLHHQLQLLACGTCIQYVMSQCMHISQHACLQIEDTGDRSRYGQHAAEQVEQNVHAL